MFFSELDWTEMLLKSRSIISSKGLQDHRELQIKQQYYMKGERQRNIESYNVDHKIGKEKDDGCRRGLAREWHSLMLEKG